MKKTFYNFTKFTALSFASVLALSGCTATSTPGPSAMATHSKNFKIDANDVVSVTVNAKPGIAIHDDAKERIAKKIKSEVDALKHTNTAMGKSDKYQIDVKLTKYEKGSAFARMMLAGLGQIHIDSQTKVLSLPQKTKIASFDLDKTFAWGGIYGASTTIENVEDGFAKGIAETVTKKKKDK